MGKDQFQSLIPIAMFDDHYRHKSVKQTFSLKKPTRIGATMFAIVPAKVMRECTVPTYIGAMLERRSRRKNSDRAYF